jgi:uncharacterized membrane protein YbhN (UPF0104 family)
VPDAKLTATVVAVPRSDAGGLAEPLPDEVAPHRLWRSIGALAALVALVVGAIALVPGMDDLRTRFEHAAAGWIVLGAVLELASTLSYVVAFRRVFCRRMSWSASYKVAMAELGADAVLPVGGVGGLALGAWALRRGGMSPEQIGRRTVAFFLLTSAANVGLVFALGVALSVGLRPRNVGLAVTLVPTVAAAAAVALTLALGRVTAGLSRRGDSRHLRRILPALRATADGVGDALALLRAGDLRLLAGVLGYVAFDILVLWAAFSALGPAPPIALLAIAYLIGQLGNLVPLPGGVGGVEAGLIGAFVLFGVDAVAATAAVLIYRALQLWIPAALGSVAFVQLTRLLRAEATEIELCAPGQDVEILGRGRVQVGGTSTTA